MKIATFIFHEVYPYTIYSNHPQISQNSWNTLLDRVGNKILDYVKSLLVKDKSNEILCFKLELVVVNIEYLAVKCINNSMYIQLDTNIG